MTPIDELATILKPAGAGLYLVSTGKAEQQALQRSLYRVSTDSEVSHAFRRNLEKVASGRGVMMGIPSDVGAGFQRGANLGPQAIRSRLLEDEADWPDRLDALGLVDVGDVFVVPQLLHDDMLSVEQLETSRAALYPGVPGAATLPVSPLSIAERAWELLFLLNPALKPFTLGGDHSTAWPVVRPLHHARGGEPWGIVQSDAHTDLLQHRLGVKYCFATWSWHANEVLGRQGRLTQVGIRATARTQEHWETSTGVRQFWAKDVLDNPDRVLDDVLAHVRATGVKGVLFSNDIDGTDARWADATGTPEPEGLEPDWVSALIRRLGAEVGLLGGDVMEVAPSLTRTPESARRTVGLAARYFRETVAAALG
ncbi:MAG: arginase family protein [Myxococcales bacterium]|nr:arginase family protein [Myxococcales bacterium]